MQEEGGATIIAPKEIGMRPYSLDLRERVAAAVDHHEGSWRPIAQTFRVSVSFISRLLGRRRDSGGLDPKPHGGGHPPALDAAQRQRLQELIHAQPDATLAELRQRLQVPCSLVAIWRTLRALKITRKKKVLHHTEQERPDIQEQRQRFAREVAAIAPERLVFVDETGANTAMTRTYGRAPVGERVAGAVPGSWESVTLIAGVRLAGVVAPWLFVGATDTAAFATYVTEVLVPELRPGDVVLWDNLGPHKNAAALQAVVAAGATVKPLPPHSPDLTPIEKLWSKGKEQLRSAAARTVQAVYSAAEAALRAVVPQDIVGWFRSCGLCPTQT
jgi:transposase